MTISTQCLTLAVITGARKTKLLIKNKQIHWTVKYRSKTPGQGACLKGMSRTIIMQCFTLAGITDAEKIKLRRIINKANGP